MKYLILIFITLTACAPSKLAPAPPSTTMMEQANTIILTPSADIDYYKEIGLKLLDFGFSIEQTDKDLGLIQTNFQTFTNGMWKYNLKAIVNIRANSIIFKGLTKDPLSGEKTSYYIGGASSSYRNSFLKLEEIAKSVPSESIQYSRQ